MWLNPQSLFFHKIAGLRPATLLQKRLCGFGYISEEILSGKLHFLGSVMKRHLKRIKQKVSRVAVFLKFDNNSVIDNKECWLCSHSRKSIAPLYSEQYSYKFCFSRFKVNHLGVKKVILHKAKQFQGKQWKDVA